MIEIKQLTVSYNRTKVLTGLDLYISAGKIVGIVGENGAGKSTLFRTIAGLEKHGGHITSKFNPLRNHAAYLETVPPMISMITGEEYLILHCNAKQIPIPDFSENNPFNLPLKKYASSYSTGMKKKLAMSALLLTSADLYVLDEPFNGVDLKSNLQLKQMILDLKSHGHSVLISSHIFSSLAEICDEIHYLYSGVIKASSFEKPFSEIESHLLGEVN